MHQKSRLSIFSKNGVHTMADFFARSEEIFSMMKAENGMVYTAQYMRLIEYTNNTMRIKA